MSDPSNYLDLLEDQALERINNFNDPHQEWRRLISEVVGTFFLVLVAAGAPMVGHAYSGTVTLAMAVVAPGVMVMAIILFMGKVSGAHLNPAVTLSFALRRDFPWKRVPGYLVAQIIGGLAAALLLTALVGVSSSYGGSYPGANTSAVTAMFVEMVLTFGLVSVILGTASGAQSVGMFAAIGVGGYIALAGLWAAPLSGASMNPVRTFAPNFVGGDLGPYWAYLIGPIAGGAIAVGFAYLMRGRGGRTPGRLAAQGTLGSNDVEGPSGDSAEQK